jgi:2-polyprenyl-6-methoxyphenol hydroxylase-like FAD-dependent oxidoreductase
MSDPRNITIVGAGMCGMVTALALARRGHRVQVFERDTAPPEGGADEAFFRWRRFGAAQFRHPHAFLGLMCNLIEEHYPQLLERFYKAGARRVDFQDMLPRELERGYVPEPGDEKLWVLLCRRATMETVIRRYVETYPNVTIRNRCHVVGLTTDVRDGALAATGLELRSREPVGAAVEQVAADLVVDASGRSSRFPVWLAAHGKIVTEEKAAAEIVYYTRHYRLKPGAAEPPRGENRSAGDLGYIKFGVFPGDNGHFAVILCVPIAETSLKAALQDPERFQRICLSIPGLAPWLAGGHSEPTTEPFGIGDIQAVWRHYVIDGEPLIHDFFAVGDAALRTNPLYGRGCSTGILHAHLLADVLDEIADPRARALAFDARTRERLRPIYDASLRQDRSGIERARALMNGEPIDRPDSLRRWASLALRDAVAAAARERIHVLRGVLRSFHLLEKPGEFLKDGAVRRTVLLYLLKGRRRNAGKRLQRGPSRNEMLELVSRG